MTGDRRVEVSNIFEPEALNIPVDRNRKTLKKQNTILESFYTEGMDFYDLDEEARAIDPLMNPENREVQPQVD